MGVDPNGGGQAWHGGGVVPNVGGQPGQGAGKGVGFDPNAGAQAGQGGGMAPNANRFTQAEGVCKMSRAVLKDLLHKQIYEYLGAWCRTPKKVAPGFCCNDACVLFANGKITFVKKSVLAPKSTTLFDAVVGRAET